MEDFQPMKKAPAVFVVLACLIAFNILRSTSTSVVIYELHKSTTIGPLWVKPTVVNEFESTGFGALYAGLIVILYCPLTTSDGTIASSTCA